MVAIALRTCQLKNGVFACRGEPVGTCQYCARRFCAHHGERLADAQEVCSRKYCVAKRDDLVRHLAYREVVLARNEGGRCGIEDCARWIQGQCSRCNGYFCARHVGPREETVIEGIVRVPRMATLCRHCWVRRPIWLRA